MKEEESVGLSLTYLTSAVRVGRRPGGGGRGSRGGGGGGGCGPRSRKLRHWHPASSWPSPCPASARFVTAAVLDP